MRLEDIGFYTLSNARCAQASETSPLWRAELIITDLCNFKCPYCRGVKTEFQGNLPSSVAEAILTHWTNEGLRNVRFSGGEPTLHKDLPEMVEFCKRREVQHVAVSTNGFSPRSTYDRLLTAGVDDFSVSLDACCSSTGDLMAGGVKGAWEKVVENIRYLSQRVYVTVGVVLTDQNYDQAQAIVRFANDYLKVADIRIIPAAQIATNLKPMDFANYILRDNPILNYRVKNIANKRPVRGLKAEDNNRCPLVLDDMAVVRDSHFPCIIYLREQGNPIGKVGPNMRKERGVWAREHDTHCDPICKRNCLDVCVDYNNKYRELHGTSISK